MPSVLYYSDRVGSLHDVPLASTGDVAFFFSQPEVRILIGNKSTTWAFSEHTHHLRPRWLLGLEAGPGLRVRGLEHISDLEPALYRFVRERIPEITRKSRAATRDALGRGVTQNQITDTLQEFYQLRYPLLDSTVIRKALIDGIQK